MTNLQHYATKAYYIEQEGCYDPKIVQLNVDSEQFMLELYEALYAFMATGKAVEAIARQPEAEGKISKNLILGCALAEATAIYGFIIGILIIFFLK